MVFFSCSLVTKFVSIAPNSWTVCADARWKGSLRHLSGREAFLTRRAVRQRQRRVHHNTRQAWRETGKRRFRDPQEQPNTLLNICDWCSDSVSRTTMATCPGSFWGSTGSLLVWQGPMSPPVCQPTVCSQSLRLGHLLAQSALFRSPVMMEQGNRKCRAESDAPCTVWLLILSAACFYNLLQFCWHTQ